MKNILLPVFLLIASICKAELKVKVYYEQVPNGYHMYVDNDEYCPVSIKIDFTVTNLTIDGGNNNIYVVKPKEKRQLLTWLIVSQKGKGYKLSYNYWTTYGPIESNAYKEDFVYDLPFPTSNSFNIHQGYNGTFSHQNENSLDFTMPVGTEITAIREGVVIKVVDINNKNCGNKDCEKFNNFILMYHPDGTMAEYTHLKQNGSKVKPGDNIAKGQLLGYSGNVGWSTGPHLHLVVFKPILNGRETLKTKFKTGDGNHIEYLKEGQEYARKY